MKIRETLLLSLSKRPEKVRTRGNFPTKELGLNGALSTLQRVFPNFLELIKNKDILDFGCGIGLQSIAMAKSKANYVLGIDINAHFLKQAKELAKKYGVTDKVNFTDRLVGHLKGKFDIVISHNSFEHFSHPEQILNQMWSVLKEEGSMLIAFGPPWLAPYGSHAEFFTSFPWVNILFDENTVMNVRRHFRNDGAKTYEDVEGGLNKMTVEKFEQILINSGMKLKHRRYECVKGLDFLGRLPKVRELFINYISCVLEKKGDISECS